MKPLTVVLSIIWMAVHAMAADGTDVTVTAMVDGQALGFSADRRARVAEGAADLLASCAYLDARPRWGSGGRVPPTIEEVRKQSHLRLVFCRPTSVMVSSERTGLKVREMVMRLPLASGGIWVRTKAGVSYLAMFDPKVSAALQKLIDEPERP